MRAGFLYVLLKQFLMSTQSAKHNSNSTIRHCGMSKGCLCCAKKEKQEMEKFEKREEKQGIENTDKLLKILQCIICTLSFNIQLFLLLFKFNNSKKIYSTNSRVRKIRLKRLGAPPILYIIHLLFILSGGSL